jgi:hypothetical protein
MEFNDAAQVLVIILSIFLAIFLVLAIVLCVLLIRVTKQIQTIAGAAKNTVDNVNNLVNTASRVAAPAYISKIFMGQLGKMFGGRKKRK